MLVLVIFGEIFDQHLDIFLVWFLIIENIYHWTVRIIMNFFGFFGFFGEIKMGRLPSELPCGKPRVITLHILWEDAQSYKTIGCCYHVKDLLHEFIRILLRNSAMAFRKLTGNSFFYWKNGLQPKTPEMSQVLHAFNIYIMLNILTFVRILK